MAEICLVTGFSSARSMCGNTPMLVRLFEFNKTTVGSSFFYNHFRIREPPVLVLW
jgi:hypothetical protein